jgi:putative SOS response-associated peptidase YedK
MCGRYSLFGPVKLSRRAIAELHDLGLDLEAALNERPAHYNIAPTQLAPVVALADDKAQVKELRWGLIPSWAKDPKIGARAINARAETVAEKPMFRAAFKKRRCLVPASGYFEWRMEGGSKQPYFIRDPGGQLMMFAGLWEAWRASEADEWSRTYTIVTGEPGRVSGDIHDRQPVILPPDLLDAWLTVSPEDALALLKVLPEAELTYHPVSKAVGSPRNKGEELVAPIKL